MMTDAPASKGPNCRFASRTPSKLQDDILAILRGKVDLIAARGVAAMPRTGEIIDALGRQRDKCGFAVVSRSLSRLMREEAILAWHSPFATRGNGAHYLINTPEALEALEAWRKGP